MRQCGACGRVILHEGFCHLCNERIRRRSDGDHEGAQEITDMLNNEYEMEVRERKGKRRTTGRRAVKP